MPHLGHKLPRTPYTRSSQIMSLSRFDWLLLRESHKRSVPFCTTRDELPDFGQMRATTPGLSVLLYLAKMRAHQGR